MLGWESDGFPVKRLIRNKRTKKFLTKEGNWTADVSVAEDFGNMDAVIKAQLRLNLTGVELLLLMENKPSSYDVVLPLGSHSPNPPAPPVQPLGRGAKGLE